MNMKPHLATRGQQRIPRTSHLVHEHADRIPRRWRWHYRVLQALRAPLLEEVRKSLTRTSERDETSAMDPTDDAAGESDRALALCLLSGEQDALHEVDSAIRRILLGTYGICEKTGNRIPMQRLRAIPWTRYTREAQEAFERQSGLCGIRLPGSKPHASHSRALGAEA